MSTNHSAYRGRLAPTPSGPLHLGHVKTFAMAWLRARRARGTLIMRIEDLDPQRTVPGMADRMMEELAWLGFDWDEGARPGSADSPFVQSNRSKHYRAALEKLEQQRLTFPCTCSRKDIQETTKHNTPVADLGMRYPGTCRYRVGTTPTEPHSIRFRFEREDVQFHDELLGDIDAAGWDGDFVVRRADNIWAYQLAVVVDDLAMGITEVVRGADLLTSTPRQLALHNALGAEPPKFAHVPLMKDLHGHKISKQHEHHTVRSQMDAGHSPTQIIGHIAKQLDLGDGSPCHLTDLL